VPDDELSLFSYEILGLVGRRGAGPHDLLRLAQRGRMLAWAGESRYYTEPKRLERLGYLSARKEPGKTRARTVYTLTDKGLRALRDYARTPASLTPLKSDALLRLLICDLVGEAPTREAITALREDIADIESRLDDADRTAAQLPHREKYLLLVIDFLRRLLTLHLELVEQVEEELVDEPDLRPEKARESAGPRSSLRAAPEPDPSGATPPAGSRPRRAFAGTGTHSPPSGGGAHARESGLQTPRANTPRLWTGQCERTNPASIFPISISPVPVVTTGSSAAYARSSSSFSASTTPRPHDPVSSRIGPKTTI
jgi:PadR family transcriptional regulator, regulatory protein AphA